MVTRTKAPRPTLIGRQGRVQQSSQQTTISKGRQQASDSEFLTSLQASSDAFINNISNLNNLSVDANQFFKNNKINVPIRLQENFKQIIRSSMAKVRTQQSTQINSLKSKVRQWASQEARFTELKNLVKEKQFFARQKQANNLIKALERGTRFTQASALRVIEAAAQREGEDARFQVARSEARFKQEKIKRFVAGEEKSGRVPSIKQLQKKFDIGLKEAKLIQSSVKIREKRVAPPSENIFDDFGSSFVNRLAVTQQSIPQNIIDEKKATSFFANAQNIPLGSKEVDKFRSLSEIEQNAIISYAVIQNAKNNLPSPKELKDLQNENTELNSLIKPLRDLKGKGTSDIIKAINKTLSPKNKVTITDLNRIEDIRSITNQSLKRLLLKGQDAALNRLNSSINSLNKYYDNIKANQTEKVNDLVKKFNNKQIASGILARINLPISRFPHIIQNVIYSGILINLRDSIRKNKVLSLSDYKEYRSSVNDLLGLKQVGSNLVRFGKRQASKSFIKGFIDTQKEIIKFMGKLTFETGRILIRDGLLLYNLAINILKIPLRLAKDILLDTLDGLVIMATKLPEQQKNLLLSRLRIRAKNLMKGVKIGISFINAIRKNPEVIMLGAALLILTGQRSIRKTIVNKPATALGEIISFIIAPTLVKGAVKGVAKIIKGVKFIFPIVLNKLVRKLPINRAMKPLFLKNNKVLTSHIPTKNFRFAFKNSKGKLFFVDKRGLKRIRRLIKFKYTNISDDIIENFIKANRTFKKFVKAQTRSQRLALQKQKLTIARTIKQERRTAKAIQKGQFIFFDVRKGDTKLFISRRLWLKAVKKQEKFLKTTPGKRTLKKLSKLQTRNLRLINEKVKRIGERADILLKKGKTPKALRIKPTNKGFPFFDYRTKQIRYFNSRKQWLRAVKQQEVAFSGKKPDRFVTSMKKELAVTKNSAKTFMEKIRLNKKGQLKLMLEQPKLILDPKLKVKAKSKALKLLRARKTLIQPQRQLLVAMTLPLVIKKDLLKILTQYATLLAKLIAFLKGLSFAELKLKKFAKLKGVKKARAIAKVKAKAKLKATAKAKLTAKAKAKLKAKAIAKSKLKAKTRLIGKVISLPKKPKQIRIPKIKLRWDFKLPRGFVWKVNGKVRIKGKTHLIRLNTTPNRALKKIGGLIDNTTARSFELVIIGVARGKDIQRPKVLKKFRSKISRGSKVLRLVEKTKFAIDTRGEKKGLSIAKALKKRSKKKPKKKAKKKATKKVKKKVKKLKRGKK